ncbi:hypothetical protein EHM69_10355 [candidate division KSB1 bacterium]|nr:MAG: hypothetical protein EHM69_10355 [candidate division KSB1 bacterium]
MSLKREMNFPKDPRTPRRAIPVSRLMKQIELMTGIRQRIRDGYYDQNDVLAEIADKIRDRLKE